MGAQLADILDCQLMDEAEDSEGLGWEKKSIKYAMNHSGEIQKYIKKTCFKMDKIQNPDVEELYQELLIRLYKKDDYREDIAQELSNREGGTIPIGAFVMKQAFYMCLTYMKKKQTAKSTLVSTFLDEHSDEKDILEFVEDKKSTETLESIVISIEDTCEEYKSNRFDLGIDIYEIMLIWVLSKTVKNSQKFYDELITLRGINAPKFNKMTEGNSYLPEKYREKREMISNFCVAIECAGIEKSLETLKKYVFGFDSYINFVNQWNA